MYLKQFLISPIAVALLAVSMQAQTAAPAVSTGAGAAQGQTATAGQGVLRGHVTDPTGALIPGAQVTVTTAAGAPVGSTTSDAAGGYVVRGLATGNYVVQVTFEGFTPYVSTPVSLSAGQSKNFDVKMSLEGAEQDVTVSEDGAPQISTEASDNADSVVLKSSDLDSLSDDPDELQNELTALAGPSAGPNGGEIYIDGFTGATLPPKSAIREIRINSNPFSAEYDRLGYGRVEILTKPGTDALHGRAFIMGNDNTFNTGNPFASSIPDYYTVQYNGSVSGSINKSASFSFNAESRNIQNDAVYKAQTAVLSNGTYVPTTLTGALFSPQLRTTISPRIDLQIGQKNTLTVRYQFADTHSTGFNTGGGGGGGGGFGGFGGGGGGSAITEPSQSTTTDSTEHQFQISDSEVINDHIVNESRLQYVLNFSNGIAASSAPAISVPGSFNAGGATSQTSKDTMNRVELQNITTMTVGAHAIKFGTRLRDTHDDNTATSNFNGTFSFPSLAAYIDTQNALYANSHSTTPLPVSMVITNLAKSCPTANACTPNKLTYNYTIGTPSALANVFDGALFFQDDWKANQFLTLSGGLRWETENHIADHSDFGPRVAFAYALDGHKKGTTSKTVLRGGYGFFYDRLSASTELSLERFNGKPGSEESVAISEPTCYSETSLSAAQAQSGSNCNSTTGTVVPQVISPHYKSPVSEQLGFSVERQLSRTITTTVNYMRTFGVHQNGTIDANAYPYVPGTNPPFYDYNSSAWTGAIPARPNSNFGPIDENLPEAIYKQQQIILSVNARLGSRLTVSGNASFNWANSNTGTFSNSYDPMLDYGRATFISPKQVFLMGTYTGPFKLTFNPFLVAQSGRPYGIATGTDLTGDSFIGQDRPSYATAADIQNSPNSIATTSFGKLNLNPGPNEAIIPANLGVGPAAVAVNLRVARTWGIGPELGSSKAQRGGGGDNGGPGGPGGGGPPPGGGPGGGGPPPGGGGFGGGPGGPGGFGGAASGRKYSLNLSVQALNLFNDIDYGTPIGTLTADSQVPAGTKSTFGESTSLAGGIFSTSSSARRVFMQLAFQF